MKIVALSDMHGHLPAIAGDADLVLIAGDICPPYRAKRQTMWLDLSFRPWLKTISAPVFGCAGNHDWPFYRPEYPLLREQVDKMNLPWIYLEDRGAEWQGLKIWGTPWQREFFDWAFNLKEEQLSEKWARIPDDTDILVCHSPPRGFGDRTPRGEEVGSIALLDRIDEVKPRLVVFGHIHSGRGNWRRNGIVLANVTVVNEQYDLVYSPFTIEIDDTRSK